jgi:ATP-dependent RNA helicase DeaD
MTLDLSVSPQAAEPRSDALGTTSLAPDQASSLFEGVPDRLRAALEKRGFTTLTSVQEAVLAAEVEGRDLQISSQTGSGKTVALGFVLARRLESERKGKGPDALIIVPTRELATQVCTELGWLLAGLPGVRVDSVTGGTPVFRDRQLLARAPRVLVGTPGRLLDHVTGGALDLGNVTELVLDEADQMLDMGFREELEGILDATPESRRTHLVSATFPDGIQRLAERYQTTPFAIEGTRLGEANADIEHVAHAVRSADRYAALLNLLLLADGAKTLVFVKQRAEAVELSDKLIADGFAALPLSGELAQSQRVRTLDAFRSGRATVLVATDVAARGLDVPDVASVIHTSAPMDAQVYTHRSGRTGRAGLRGRSVLLASPNHKRKLVRLLREAGVESSWLPVPRADAVRAELALRQREKLQRELETELCAELCGERLAQAEELLHGREPTRLVAALLARLEPERRAEPRDVEAPGTAAEEWRADRAEKGNEPMAPRRPRAVPNDMVRFFVNWGVNQGATPGRLLAALCRRGQVKGGDIGSIAIHPNASTFDVRASLAESFERLAGRRDPRDPRTLIRRDRGPRNGGTARSRQGGSGRSRS